MTFSGFRLSRLIITILVTLRSTVFIVILYFKSKEFQSTVFLEGVYTETLGRSGIQIFIVCEEAGGVRTIVLLLACFLSLPTHFFTTRIEVVYTQAIPAGCYISITISYDQYMLAVLLGRCAINKFPTKEFAILVHFIFFSRTLGRKQFVAQREISQVVGLNDDSFILTIAKHILGIIGHILTSPIYSGFSIMQIQLCAIIALSVLIRTSFNVFIKSSKCSSITRNGNYLAVFSYSSCVYRRSREANNFILQWSCRSTCSG